MRDIHCPKDVGFENTFSGEDCKKEQHYNNCYHCWSTALAKEKEHWVMPILDDNMRDSILSKGMRIIDVDKFLAYLIFSKHIDSLTCGEVKEAVEMCKADVFDMIKKEIEQIADEERKHDEKWSIGLRYAIKIIDKYKEESEDKNASNN